MFSSPTFWVYKYLITSVIIYSSVFSFGNLLPIHYENDARYKGQKAITHSSGLHLVKIWLHGLATFLMLNQDFVMLNQDAFL